MSSILSKTLSSISTMAFISRKTGRIETGAAFQIYSQINFLRVWIKIYMKGCPRVKKTKNFINMTLMSTLNLLVAIDS
jgi:hypothetical protein